MNPNPQAKRILCYGDSNTWGRGGKTEERYPANMRWTGLLQARLGDGYEVIEEGLRSRTTDIDDSKLPGRNGLTYLRPCLESQSPIDLVILWLGTNDLKDKFERKAEDVARSEILLVTPPIIDASSLKSDSQFKQSQFKSEELPKYYKQLAEKYNCEYVNLQQYVSPGKDDGVHLDPEAHKVIAELFSKEIVNLV